MKVSQSATNPPEFAPRPLDRLTRLQQSLLLRRLRREGWQPTVIAEATGLTVDAVCELLKPQRLLTLPRRRSQ